MTRHHSCRVSPFGHPRINARLAAPRGISQPPTSFIGSQCQGIHHAPLNTYNTKTKNEFQKKLHINTQKSDTHPKAGATPLRARCSQPLSTNQTPHPTTKVRQQHADTRNRMPPPKRGTGLLSQSPIVCLAVKKVCCAPNRAHYRQPVPHGSGKTQCLNPFRGAP